MRDTREDTLAALLRALYHMGHAQQELERIFALSHYSAGLVTNLCVLRDQATILKLATTGLATNLKGELLVKPTQTT